MYIKIIKNLKTETEAIVPCKTKIKQASKREREKERYTE
jgi:hypothetical protein